MTHPHLLGLLSTWELVSDHPFSGSLEDLSESLTLDFFKPLSPEVLGRKEVAPFVCLESEKEANQAAGRFRICSITIYRKEKCQTGK